MTCDRPCRTTRCCAAGWVGWSPTCPPRRWPCGRRCSRCPSRARSGRCRSSWPSTAAASSPATGVPARLVQLGDVRPLDVERTTLLVAAVREGLLNAEKHAQAGTVVVSLGEVDGGVQVAVVDDGSPGTTAAVVGSRTGDPVAGRTRGSARRPGQPGARRGRRQHPADAAAAPLPGPWTDDPGPGDGGRRSPRRAGRRRAAAARRAGAGGGGLGGERPGRPRAGPRAHSPTWYCSTCGCPDMLAPEVVVGLRELGAGGPGGRVHRARRPPRRPGRAGRRRARRPAQGRRGDRPGRRPAPGAARRAGVRPADACRARPGAPRCRPAAG